VQVRGRKRIVFFPPSEALNLYLDGDKSLVLDIDNPDISAYPNFRNVERFEAVLEEGDIVFIPSLWFHNVIALNFSVSVNIFWKNLKPNFYDDKDTYGNRDLVAAQSVGARRIS
jgi:tRNA wybutosine-synthesizing protein 5